MEDDDRELICRLSTRAGMILEDISMLALTMPAHDEEARSQTLTALTDAAQVAAALINAAASLDRHMGRGLPS